MEQDKTRGFTINSKFKNLTRKNTYGWDILKEGQLDYGYYEEINRKISQDIYLKFKTKDTNTKPVSSIP